MGVYVCMYVYTHIYISYIYPSVERVFHDSMYVLIVWVCMYVCMCIHICIFHTCISQSNVYLDCKFVLII